MSRSYEEDWQRRKSLLIRSLFYDKPMLSPVPEESYESDLPCDSIDRPYRPYSPLPPLVIEKEPDRHDEPEEYYSKLLKKIKKIYRKLFIENQSLASDDFNITEGDLTGTYDDDNELNLTEDSQDETGNDSRFSINSEGYGADFESNDTESSDSEIDSDSNDVEISNTGIDYEEYVEEESLVKEIGEEYSNEDGAQDINKNISNNNEDSDKTVHSNKTSIHDQDSFDVGNNNHEINKADENTLKEQTFLRVQRTNDFGLNDQVIALTEESDVNSNESDRNVLENKSKSKDSLYASNEEDNELIPEAMDEDEMEIYTSREGIDYRQITTEALIHVDGTRTEKARESPIYEDVRTSPIYEDVRTSPILPSSAPPILCEHTGADDKVEEIALLVDNEDPDKAPDNVSEGSIEPIELMRTPRTDLSLDSNPVLQYSNSDITDVTPHATEPHMTSESEENNVPELNHSDDINDILHSILNQSQIDVLSNTNTAGRKRKMYEDMSIQTCDRVSWHEIRDNFFVGSPKIFKLCRCVDHTCL